MEVKNKQNEAFEIKDMGERVFQYLKGMRYFSIIYHSKGKRVETFTDASFADFKGFLTACGYIIRLFGDAITWRSHKQSYVALLTCQAECVAMSEF